MSDDRSDGHSFPGHPAVREAGDDGASIGAPGVEPGGQPHGVTGETVGGSGEAIQASAESDGACGESDTASGESDAAASQTDGAGGESDAASGETAGAGRESDGVGGETAGAGGESDGAGSSETDGAAGESDGAGSETDGTSREGEETRQKRPPSRRRRAGFAVLRALVVLVVAALAYVLVVPTVHVVRGRLSRLVLSKPGVTAFDKTAPQAGQQDDTQTGIAALTSAAKRSPNQTGLYSIEWSPTDTSGAGIIAFLLPSNSTATTALSQIRAQQFAAGSYSANSLTRALTYAVPGVPGSYAAVYRPPAKDARSAPSLAVSVFRYGRVVAVSEAASIGSTAEPAVNAITTGEYTNLRHVGSGFSLSVTRYPALATTLWAAVAAVVAAIVALVPVARRRRAQRRQRAYEEEMAHRVVVGKQVIVKHRR